MKKEIFLTAMGAVMVVIGVVRGNELMLATGVIVIAIDCGASRVVAAIKNSQKVGSS